MGTAPGPVWRTTVSSTTGRRLLRGRSVLQIRRVGARQTLPLVVTLACLAAACSGTKVTGTVSVSGNPTLGTWSKTVDGCEKADGITLLSGGTAVLAVSSDPVAGNSIELPNPTGGAPTQLFANNCRTLQVDTHFNGTTITNDNVSHDQEVDGSVDADCDLPGGGTVTASASFANCL